MKKAVLAVTALSVFFAASLPALAKKSPEEVCKGLAEKHHVTAEKMDAYMKTCVEKHTKKTHKTPAAEPAAPSTPAPSKPAE
jgi:hypothetical protein